MNQVKKCSNILTTKGYSSDLVSFIPYNLLKYIKILKRQENLLKKRYKNTELFKVFETIPQKILTVGPIVLCDYLTTDLGRKCPNEVLAGIGMMCLQISSHDDAVDETPSKQRALAGLIYAGNIASLEGVRALIKKDQNQIANTVIGIVNKNHLLQQNRVELLWEKSPKNFIEYKRGVADGAELIKIGVFTALAIARKNNLKKQLAKFAMHYALALQLIDDIREVEEDREAGYHSFPLLEGFPFTKSLSYARKSVKLAASALEKEWKLTNSLVTSVGQILNFLEKGLQNEKVPDKRAGHRTV